MRLNFLAVFFFEPSATEIVIGQLDKKMETTLAEAKKANDELARINEKYEADVKRINEELGKKGASLEDILNDVKELKAKTNRIVTTAERSVKSIHEVIANNIEAKAAEIKSTGKFKFGVEQKDCAQMTKAAGTMTATNNLTGNTVITYNLVPAVRGRQAVHMRDLVRTVPSATGTWQFYRQNTPVGEGSFDFQTTHGNTKNQLDYDLTAVTVNAEYLAGFAVVARQMMTDLPFLQTFVNDEMVEDYLRTETFKFMDRLAGGGEATGNSGTAATVTVERIIDYIANLMQANYQPNAIVCRPALWAQILKTKPNDYSIPGGVTISPTGDVMIIGLPVVACTTNALPDNRLIVGDWSKAAIIQTEGLSVGTFEQDNDNVRRNVVTVRVESRVGFAVLRPDAFVYGTGA